MVKVDKDLIQIPYTTRPSMRRYTGPIFNPNPDPGVIKQKQIELAKWGRDLYGEIDSSIEHQLIKCAAEFCNVKPVDSIVDLALQFEEDLAIIHQGVLAAICFCFPSSWIPAKRLNWPLSSIHEAVADGELLVRSSSRIAETMATNGPFRRHVWTITNSPDLNQHPENKSQFIPKSLDELYFRTETQTTVALGNGVTSLFFVKVDTYSLIDVWSEIGDSIIQSIDSMTDAVIEYKNLRHIKALIK